MKFKTFYKLNESKNVSDIIFYHGTTNDFEKFDSKLVGKNFKRSIGGIYFINDKKFAKTFTKIISGKSPKIISAKLSMKNPLIVDSNFTDSHNLKPVGYGDDDVTGWVDDEIDTVIKYAKKNSSDGILVYDETNKIDGQPTILAIVFNPEDIEILNKEVIENK
jgi:uncharacterized protein YukJ